MCYFPQWVQIPQLLRGITGKVGMFMPSNACFLNYGTWVISSREKWACSVSNSFIIPQEIENLFPGSIPACLCQTSCNHNSSNTFQTTRLYSIKIWLWKKTKVCNTNSHQILPLKWICILCHPLNIVTLFEMSFYVTQ